jgi:hypothetical protein
MMVRFLSFLEYIQGQSSRGRIECVVNLSTREEKRFCGRKLISNVPDVKSQVLSSYF